jgi:hypothetical protein
MSTFRCGAPPGAHVLVRTSTLRQRYRGGEFLFRVESTSSTHAVSCVVGSASVRVRTMLPLDRSPPARWLGCERHQPSVPTSTPSPEAPAPRPQAPHSLVEVSSRRAAKLRIPPSRCHTLCTASSRACSSISRYAARSSRPTCTATVLSSIQTKTMPRAVSGLLAQRRDAERTHPAAVGTLCSFAAVSSSHCSSCPHSSASEWRRSVRPVASESHTISALRGRAAASARPLRRASRCKNLRLPLADERHIHEALKQPT